jgi:hypothetical protein
VAAKRGLIEGGPFYRMPGKPILVRDRSGVVSTTLRRPEMLPPEEIDQALLQIIDDHFGAKPEELVQATSRAFGYSATSAQLRATISAGIERLVRAGAISEKDGFLIRTTSTLEPITLEARILSSAPNNQ